MYCDFSSSGIWYGKLYQLANVGQNAAQVKALLSQALNAWFAALGVRTAHSSRYPFNMADDKSRGIIYEASSPG